ncbi:hypothetical protein MASR2M18_21720 [Ignavibacteria bacterium]|nr:hypothetical protein [Bacteroidota bacterium]MCZ2131590.1 hypothetical protein [Bacteroidota bacterium]
MKTKLFTFVSLIITVVAFAGMSPTTNAQLCYNINSTCTEPWKWISKTVTIVLTTPTICTLNVTIYGRKRCDEVIFEDINWMMNSQSPFGCYQHTNEQVNQVWDLCLKAFTTKIFEDEYDIEDAKCPKVKVLYEITQSTCYADYLVFSTYDPISNSYTLHEISWSSVTHPTFN